MAGVLPGEVIAGKFRVERVLGEGGMGYVVAARHLQLGQMVALKLMHDAICTPDYKSRFLREARNTVRLKSKHVSRVLDVGALDGGAPYMVMEYLEGTDLSDLLQKRGPVPVHEACEYILQACEAVAEAHSYGIIHRDLKPANLFLIRGPGGEPIVKVLDFGVSKVLDLGMEEATNAGGRPTRGRPDSVVTKATDILGSPSYMAPEQIVSASDADARSDIWSLGVILFRLISGVAPFHAASLGELIQGILHGPIPNLRDSRPDLPPGLEHVVARCLQRDRSQRLGDVTELARMLAAYAGPVATPSFERIALLGPALVAFAPPAPMPSGPSLSSNPSANPAAFVSPPMPLAFIPPEPVKKELTAPAAAILAAVFALFVTLTVLAAIAALRHRAGPSPVRATAAPSANPAPTTPNPSALTEPAVAPVVSAVVAPAGSPKPPPIVRRPLHAPVAAPRVAVPVNTPTGEPAPPPAPIGGAIPATRERP